jgi:hypothetical protein
MNRLQRAISNLSFNYRLTNNNNIHNLLFLLRPPRQNHLPLALLTEGILFIIPPLWKEDSLIKGHALQPS